jgi:type I restriction enzyme S subunit
MTWPMVKLGEVLIERRERIGTADANGLPLLGVSNVDGLHRSGLERIPDMSRYFRVEKDWFAYNPMRINVGSVGWAKHDEQTGVISPDYVVFSCSERVLAPLVFWFLKHRRGLAAINGETAGSVRERLYFESLSRINFPLPPLAEQQRLVARIDALATKIDEAKRLREEADEESSALVSSLHTNLAGDRVVRLSDVLALHEDRVPIVADGEYPQVGVKGFGGGLFARETLTANQTTYKGFNRLETGMLVLSQVKGWEGAVAVCPHNLAGRFASPEYRTFRCKPYELDAHYLAMIVPTEWFWGRLATLTRGVGARRERIRPELFMQMTIPMPNVADQQRALAVCRQLEKAKPDRATIPVELNALLPAILDRALRGEL